MQCTLICERSAVFSGHLCAAIVISCYLFLTFLNNFFPSVEPATFVEKLEPSQLLKKGDATQLVCKVTGTPPIKITWFVNDREIKDSSRHKMSFVKSTAVLRLTDAAVEDSGEYMCEAQNEAGSDHCGSILIVKGLCSPCPLHYQNCDP